MRFVGKEPSLIEDLIIIAGTVVWGGWILCHLLYRSRIDYSFLLFGHYISGFHGLLVIMVLVALRLLLYFLFVSHRDIDHVVTLSISCFLLMGFLLLIEREKYIVLLITGIAVFSCLTFIYIRGRRQLRGLKGRKRKYARNLIKTKMYLMLILIMNVTGFVVIAKEYMNKSNILRATDDYESVEGVNHKEYYEDFMLTNYKNLNEQEKLDLIQKFANSLTDMLGVDRCPVYSGEMTRDTLLGYYDVNTGRIYLSKDILNDPETVIDCLSHEIYHRYQHSWIELYARIAETDETTLKIAWNLYEFKQARTWLQENKHYHSYAGNGSEDYLKYYNQDMEQTANAFGEQIANEFKDYEYHHIR